ncbi:hypothetical protein [Streptacidiphilus sp. P02-A3a]|uniref:hypothetical protein n=1 Tax=Streptacidiphilus sp. P02-A3a TaxID=2704468 RepID=UPI0015FA791F|nr:hypothetical protein [Streptacidiphilus sp. P02-A3a]QMU73201.1 hypothetical protein GXP74_38195 [Streptacidiphilus sp. P02-A3a]
MALGLGRPIRGCCGCLVFLLIIAGVVVGITLAAVHDSGTKQHCTSSCSSGGAGGGGGTSDGGSDGGDGGGD